MNLFLHFYVKMSVFSAFDEECEIFEGYVNQWFDVKHHIVAMILVIKHWFVWSIVL